MGEQMATVWHKTFLAGLAACGVAVLPAGGYPRVADEGGQSRTAGDLNNQLVVLEEQSYAAWKSGDLNSWAALLSDKFVGWGRTGRVNKSAAKLALKEAKCKIGSYRLADQQLSQLTPNAAVLTHRTEATGTCGGKQLGPASYTATVYVREAGEWKIAFRAQSAIVDPMKAAKPAASELWTGGRTRSDVLTQTLLAREQAVWNAWKDHDAKRIDALLGDSIQFIDIFGDHIGTREETLKTWSGEGCDVKSFDIDGAKATMFAPDFGILTVRATTHGTCFGQDVWPIWGTTLYVKRGNAWLWTFGINVLAGAS